jgi:hypothetical protein
MRKQSPREVGVNDFRVAAKQLRFHLATACWAFRLVASVIENDGNF